tara:strand:- start:143 stop:343 length:201 start_codon:yes stop_codon:yes gene_type:complete
MDEDLLSLLKTIDKYHNFFPEMAYVAMCKDLRRIHIKLSEKRRVRAGRAVARIGVAAITAWKFLKG